MKPAHRTTNELLFDLEEAMRDVVDPELGINVVDLGLVYGLNVEKGDEGTVALLDMTLTSAACPLTDVIEDQSRSAWSAPAWSTTCGSTGSGTRRGARTRSPKTGANNCARSASPSKPLNPLASTSDGGTECGGQVGIRWWCGRPIGGHACRAIVIACSAPPSFVP